MTDVLLLAVLLAFFALSIAFVRACERIIGPDLDADVPAEATESAPDRRAA